MFNVDCKCNVIVIVILIHNYPFRLFYGDWGSILTSCHVALEWPIKISAACIQNSFTITNWNTKAKQFIWNPYDYLVIHPNPDGTVVALSWHCRSIQHCRGTLWHCCGTIVALLWHSCGTLVALLWHSCGRVVALSVSWHCPSSKTPEVCCVDFYDFMILYQYTLWESWGVASRSYTLLTRREGLPLIACCAALSLSFRLISIRFNFKQKHL